MTMAGAGVHFAAASELRVGKYCLINGFPCRIRDIQRSAPGKHGHAKLRVVGVGLFDQRKRETIFGAHDQVLIPKVETRANILASRGAEGYRIASSPEGLPSVLAYGDDKDHELNDQTTSLAMTVIIACGHVQVVEVRSISKEETEKIVEDQERIEPAENSSYVLSKKEQRKQRKLSMRQAALTA